MDRPHPRSLSVSLVVMCPTVDACVTVNVTGQPRDLTSCGRPSASEADDTPSGPLVEPWIQHEGGA